MKRIFLVMLLFAAAFSANAQNADLRAKRVIADQVLLPPYIDTILTPSRIGQVVIRPQDSLWYVGIKITSGGKRWDLLANWIGSIAGSAGIDDVLAFNQAFTTDRRIAGGTLYKNFAIDSMGQITFRVYELGGTSYQSEFFMQPSFGTKITSLYNYGTHQRQSIIESIPNGQTWLTGGNNADSLSQLKLSHTGIELDNDQGSYTITNLPTAANMTDKFVMVWDSVNNKALRIKKDSIGTAGGGSGTVTSIATNNGTGITGGTITTTGTLALDTLNVVETKANAQHKIDSLAGTISGGTPGGSAKQIQYNNTVFGGAAGFEYQSGASPNVLIQSQNAGHVPLLVKSVGSTQSADVFRVMRYDDSTYFRVSANGSVTIGPAYDYVNAIHPPGHEFRYSNSGYTGGIKIRNHNSGSEVRLHTVNNGLFLTDNGGSAAPMTLGTRTNPADASTFVAASGVWTISAGRFGVGGTADASAIIDGTSTTKGFLPPRMTGAQQNAISAPATGLMIYNTDSAAYTSYNGSAWRIVGKYLFGLNDALSSADRTFNLNNNKFDFDSGSVHIKAKVTSPRSDDIFSVGIGGTKNLYVTQTGQTYATELYAGSGSFYTLGGLIGINNTVFRLNGTTTFNSFQKKFEFIKEYPALTDSVGFEVKNDTSGISTLADTWANTYRIMSLKYRSGVDNSLTERFDFRGNGDFNITGTGATKLQAGNTSQRPSTPTTGMMRFNTDSTAFEYYNGSAWLKLGTGTGSSGVTGIGSINSATKSSNGAVVVGTNLIMQNADATYPGLMSPAHYNFLDSVRLGLVADSSYLGIILGPGSYDSLYAYMKPYGTSSWVSSFQLLIPKVGLTNPMTTTGDMIYATDGTIPTRLPIGTNGQVLQSNGTIPVWTTLSAGSGTVSSGTQYRLAYYATTGTTVSEAAAITANRALISNANGVPTHATTTATELGYVSGVTSAIQTQIDGKISASSTNTLTNKRWTARVGSTTSSATPTINTDNYDIYKLTAQTADITSFTTNLTGTPNDGDILEIQVTGTAARAITWGASFVASTVALPTTTVTTATLTTVFQFYTTSSYGNNKWVCVNSY